MKQLFQSIVLFAILFSLNAQAYNSTGTLTVNGMARTFVFHSAGATAPTASSNLPLFIMMHGDSGSGSGIKSYCGLDAIADANNFIAVYPDGQMAGSSRTWNQYIDGTPGRPDNANLADDLPFLDALIEHFKTTYGINCQKVYAAGHSSGAFMAYYAAIAMPNKIAAIAPYAGSTWYDTNDPISNAYYNANFSSAVPVLHIHGTADNTVSPPATTWSWPLMLYIQGQGCNPGNPTLDASLYPNANGNTYYAQSYYYNHAPNGSICATAPYKHRLVLINSQGHGWPTQDINEFNIAQEMWSFVNQYTLSATCQAVEPPPTTSVDNRIKVDQFGYQTNAQKVAVISNPQTGYNVSTNFIPGSTYQVRLSLDSSVVFSGSPVAWNGGATHSQSGDKVWWFDFSTLTTEGTYHIYDPTNNVTSYEFEISDCVYDATMRQAVRTFYYQRCGSPKSTPHAHANWQDATACHLGALQDHNCRSILDPTAATSKDLWGGWHDAGDYNKYVNFLYDPMINLLLAYEEKPAVWADDYNIPESGNGVPDLLDETKYELDWLLRMQQTDGGVLCVVGVQNYASASPPSADNAQRFYGPATTSASYTAAAIFALAAKQYNSIGNTTYATTLQTAAINAYNWANANPSITYNNYGIVAAGEQEIDAYNTQARKIAAAAFLYALTSNATYKTYVEANYTSLHLFQWSFAFPFESGHQSAILYYSKQTGVTTSVKNNIRNIYSNSLSAGNADNLPAYTNNTDAYRAYLSDNNYGWGSNWTKSRQGTMLASMNMYSLDVANATNYNNAAAGYIHYLHGINPIAITYLSNMSSYGAENSVNEFYHGWFTDGSALWDRVGVSTYGPAPGFIPGGANPSYNPDVSYVGPAISPPQNQPIQKSFKDWNTGWPQNSWEITENAIYTQASYIRLLAQFMCCSASQNIVITGNTSICNANTTTLTATGGGTYAWSNGITTASNTIASAGTYTVTVTNTSGCTGTASATVTSSAVTAVATNSGPICQGGTATLTATGGTTYLWSNGAATASTTATLTNTATYTVTITNSNGCMGSASTTVLVNPLPTASISGNTSICGGNATVLTASGGGTYAWSNSSTTSSITVANAGTYTVTVTSTNGCARTASATVSIFNTPVASISGNTVVCNSPTTLTASGGGVYLWSNNSTASAITVTALGTYTVTVTNPTTGCSSTASVTVTGGNATAVATNSGPICQGGTATLTATGGTTYLWSNGAATASTTATLTNTATYTVTITNSNGCMGSASTTVLVNPLPTASISGNTSICGGNATVLTASGGGTYAWSNSSTTSSITVANAGTYTVTVTSTNGCARTASATVSIFNTPVASISGNTVVCNSPTTLTASGGGVYLWSNNSTASAITVTALGTYTVTVTNPTTGCSSTASVTVTGGNATAVATNSGPICQGGTATLTATGGSTYLWSNGAATASTTATPTTTTTYTVTITNANGCVGTATTTVVVNASPTLSIGNIVNPTCSNANGSMKVTVTGGVSPYIRLWSNGSTATTISNLSAGTYTVTVTGGNGCTVSASASISNTALAVPTNLTTTNITGTTATFNWSAVTGAANYTILARKVGTATWTTLGPITGTSKNIQSQIACGKTYEWKVRANCADGITASAYSTAVTFTTTACPTASGKTSAEWDGGFKTFSLSPNPANNLVTLYYSTETETPLNISIIDLTGRIILQQNTLATQGDNTINLTTNQLPQGYYVVELNDGTDKMHEKLLIAR